MTSPTPLILIGTGEYYRKILTPALARLIREGVVELILTVDVRERGDDEAHVFSGVPHRTRGLGEALSTILRDQHDRDPIVILGHANNLHVSDAEDLVRAGFRVLIEKPFARDGEELSRLMRVIEDAPSQVGLIEYYLTMKSAPLFMLTGHLDRDSFFTQSGLLMDESHEVPTLHDIGAIRHVYVDVLEGEGQTGRLDHRGDHLISRKKGGGMIHDLAIHALAPIMPLEEMIGEVMKDTMRVRSAHSREYVAMAHEVFGIPSHDIGESYAEIELMTTKHIPLTIRVGKYVCGGTNRRSLTLVGENGSYILDLSDPRISLVREGMPPHHMFSLPKTDEKYYAVLMASLLELEGRSPFRFSIRTASLRAHALVLHAVALLTGKGIEHLYETGIDPEDMF